MQWTAKNHHQSTFGLRVIDKKLITQKPMTQHHIPGLTRSQRGLRWVTALMASLIAPLQVYAADAPVFLVPVAVQTAAAIQRHGGMQNMSERELSRAEVQAPPAIKSGRFVQLNRLATDQLMNQLDNYQLMNPMLLVIDAKATIRATVPDHVTTAPRTTPASQDVENRFYSLCLPGNKGPCMGSVSVTGIDKRGTTYSSTLR